MPEKGKGMPLFVRSVALQLAQCTNRVHPSCAWAEPAAVARTLHERVVVAGRCPGLAALRHALHVTQWNVHALHP